MPEVPQVLKKFSLSDLGELVPQRRYDFPRAPNETLNELMQALKPGDFMRWEGYADFEFPAVYKEVCHQCALFGMEKPSYENFVAASKLETLANPVYGVVREIIDKRTKAWQDECHAHRWSTEIPKESPVIVCSISFDLRGADENYSLMSLHGFDSLQEHNPYPIQRVKRIEKEDALRHLVDKISRYQTQIDSARDKSERERLLACIAARKQFRLAEIGHALIDSSNPLETIQKLKQESLVHPETGYYVLLPDQPVPFQEVGPKLIFIKDDNDFRLNEYQTEKFVQLMIPQLYGPSQTGVPGYDVGYRCFGIPHRNLGLIDGIEAIEIHRPKVSSHIPTNLARHEFGQRNIESFLLESSR
jgi:hypothetical protein